MSSRKARAEPLDLEEESKEEMRDEVDVDDEDSEVAAASSSSPSASPSRPQTASSANGVDQSIQVLCRFRPESSREIAESGPSAIVEFDSSSHLRDPSVVGEGVHLNLDGGKRSASYRFDRVFQPHATQEDVFESIGAPTVKAVLEGYNAAVIAYGQTGSGKTHSMMGPGFDGRALGEASAASSSSSSSVAVTGEPGLIPRIMASLFSQISALESDTIEFQMRACYIEIYQENVRDLLNPIAEGPNRRAKLSLEIRQDTHRGMLLPDATEVPLHSLQDVYEVLKLGGKHRKVASTKANDASSRSHAILLVTLQRSNVITRVTKISQLYLVDLAGSEKVSKTEVTGLNLVEANKINAGLLALGQVIQALVAQSQTRKQIYVPYRNSKLTRLLSNCVGGNSRTSLLINCSPSLFNLQETISTLRFGSAMKQIKQRATINVEISLSELKALYRASQEENEALKASIKALQSEIKLMQEVQRFEAIRAESAAVEAARIKRAEEEDQEFEMQQQLMQMQRQQLQQQQQTPRIQPRLTPAKVAFAPQAVFTTARPASAASGASSSELSESPEAPDSASVSASSSSASSSSQRPRVSSPSSELLDFNSCSDSDSALESSPEPCSARGGVTTKEMEEQKHQEHDEQGYDQSADSMEPGASAAEPVDMRAALRAETLAESSAPGSQLLQSMRSAHPSLLSRSTAGDLRQLLLHFLCPLSKKLMRDPVIALDGHCYERRAIATYLLNHSTSPVSGQALSSKLLVPNLGLQAQIRKFYPQSQAAASAAKAAGPKSFLSVSNQGIDEMDVSYFSCLPLAVLSYLSEFADARTLCRFGQTNHEHAAVASENRLWKLLVLRKGWELDMSLVREVGSSVKTYYKTVWKQKQPLSNRAREASAAFMAKGVYLVPKPAGGVAAVNLHLN